MNDSLRELDVIAIDAQASGASPEHGDLLELGWARCAATGLVGSVKSFWVVPRTGRPIRRAVRELTGWTEGCLADAIDEQAAWMNLWEDAGRSLEPGAPARIRTVIHFARFELPFLKDLHVRFGDGGDFPFDTVCLHAVAARLLPDLPRRNIRALAGYLGHSPELTRRSGGHVDATAFIWQALLPLLEQARIHTWTELRAWVDEARSASRRAKRVFPFTAERRRALPDRAGIYRFVRRNGDVMYVGKATSLKKRIAGHFKSRGPATERSLELLSQVHDIDFTETASLLEAALLECDEIKRLDPPYNVQLRAADRTAWFSIRDFRHSSSEPDEGHSVGPLPSERALSSLQALIALSNGRATPSRGLRAEALAVPAALLPDDALFADGWRIFSIEHLSSTERDVARCVQKASLALWLARGRAEIESNAEDASPREWDLARVRRRLERSLVQTGLLVRRARFLVFLVDSVVAFREPASRAARYLELSRGDVVARGDVDGVSEIVRAPAKRRRSFRERQCAFDAATYDRLRVLLTELLRVLDEGGDVGIRVGSHSFVGERLRKIVRGL
jgi:hypothetical protein